PGFGELHCLVERIPRKRAAIAIGKMPRVRLAEEFIGGTGDTVRSFHDEAEGANFFDEDGLQSPETVVGQGLHTLIEVGAEDFVVTVASQCMASCRLFNIHRGSNTERAARMTTSQSAVDGSASP